MKSPAKIDLEWDQQELNAFLMEKTGHGFSEYASILAHVLMEIPIGKPFGSEYLISNEKIKKITEILKETEKAGIQIDPDLRREHPVLFEESLGGRPVDERTVIICLWAPLAKRNGKVPWAMLVRLLRWFYKQFKIMNYDYASKIYIRNDEANKKDGRQKFYWGKQFKHLCMIKNKITKSGKNKITKSERAKLDKLLSDPKIMDSFLAWLDRRRKSDRKSDWKDKNIDTIVTYLRVCHFNNPQRRFFPRKVHFSGDGIEVEADYRDGGELKTLRMKRDFKTQELTQALLDCSDQGNFESVTFSN